VCKRASRSHDHRDPAFVRVTSQIVFETYWKDVEAGKGPALIVWFEHRKILKFDCFGKGRGHNHLSVPVHSKRTEEFNRIFLPEETIEAQIERVVFELRTNLFYYLARAPHRRARVASIPKSQLTCAVEEVRALLYERRLSALAHP
jgi:hypothetical protein